MKIVYWLALAAAVSLLAACGGGGPKLPEPTPFDPAVAERLHAIRARMSEIRGLPPYEKAIEGTLSREALAEYASQQVQNISDEDKAELEAYTAALRLLGLIGPEDDLLELFTTDYVGNTLGMYLAEEDRLVLVGDPQEIGMQGELTLAHEYLHSFQDGAFGFEALEKWTKSESDKKGQTQYEETISCLREGDAEVGERLYAEQVFGADWQAQLQQEQRGGEAVQRVALPEFLERASLFNYRECEQFVQNLYDEGGWEAVNAAYQNPPATTEQVLHPQKYEAQELGNGQEPDDLSDRLGKGWKPLDASQFGEFDVYNYAVSMTDDELAARVAGAGWGAGWLTVYRSKEDASRVVVQLSLSWDSNQDMQEFLMVYGAILESLGVSWQPPSDKPQVGWTSDAEYGFVSWDDVVARVDILIATDEAALDLAMTA